ncbi:homeobox protein Nkx-2.2 [Sarcoptes scabiei]|nr:homeobox protein Nkx-2.2 [Sarcoptes scabiei]
MMNISILWQTMNAYNWIFLILVCHCRPDLIIAQRLTHRTRLLDSENVYKERPKVSFTDIDPIQDLGLENNGRLLPADIIHINDLRSLSNGDSTSSSMTQKHRRYFADKSLEIDPSDSEDRNVCIAPDSRTGTCYDASTCVERGGIPMGRCNQNTKIESKGNVCCLFETTCGQTTKERHVYFRNPNFPQPFDGQRICRIKINKIDSAAGICQLRLGFDQFDIAKPIEGNCTQDSFLISGQNENNIVPRICGFNTGQHYYIGIDESGMITLHMVFRGSYQRKFDIHIEQLDCGSKKLAPSHCLQYYEGTQGTIKSFNYDNDEQEAMQSNLNRQDSINSITEGYPNNVDYMICIRKETGFCSISYEFMSDFSGAVLPFSVGLSPNQFFKRNGFASPNSNENSPFKTYSTVPSNQCDDDYLIVSGMKVCTRIIDTTIVDDVGNDKENTIVNVNRPTEFPEVLITPGNITENRNNELIDEFNHRNRRQAELFQDSLSKRYRWMMNGGAFGSGFNKNSPNSNGAGNGNLQNNYRNLHHQQLQQQSQQKLAVHHQNYLMATDSTPGPFQLRFVSNSINNAKGFYLSYRQNPCKM